MLDATVTELRNDYLVTLPCMSAAECMRVCGRVTRRMALNGHVLVAERCVVSFLY